MAARLSNSEAGKLGIKVPKANKYGAKKCVIDGIRFDSQAEGSYYAELKIRERKGEISGLAVHKKYDLIVNDAKVGTYKPDFCFWDHAADRFRCVDVKGVIPRGFSRTQKLMKALYQITVEVAK